jgi:hypothetical protein
VQSGAGRSLIPKEGRGDSTHVVKSRLQSWIATPLLLTYMTTLVVSAWPPEIRPAWLDAPSEGATAFLFQRFGIVAGEPLFNAAESSDWLRRAFCVKVRSHTSTQRRSPILFPRSGLCQVDGFRIRLPPVDRTLHRLLVIAWGASESGKLPTPRSDRFLARIGQHFCFASKSSAAPGEQVSLIWYWYHENYLSGEIRHYNALQFRFDCEDNHLARQRWNIDDRAFATFWGARPWE